MWNNKHFIHHLVTQTFWEQRPSFVIFNTFITSSAVLCAQQELRCCSPQTDQFPYNFSMIDRQFKREHIIKTPSYLFNKYPLMAQFTLALCWAHEWRGESCWVPVRSPPSMLLPPTEHRPLGAFRKDLHRSLARNGSDWLLPISRQLSVSHERWCSWWLICTFI